ncbi:MAG: RNA 2',3'-cyclic phosphodiesterase [Clostridiaceae bacterium]|nr:RNA 2',3'-cyclic phosphodiesterase [Clostridiaceae bacterium]
MRSFIAIELDNNTREFLCNIQRDLESHGIHGNYSRPENLHLTLKFLGEINEFTFKKIAEIIKKVADNNKSFILSLNSVGKFNKGNRSIVWAGLERNEFLFKIYQELQSELERILPDIEKKAYSPHITLIREARPYKEVSDFIDKYKVPGHKFPAEGISLMESTRIEGKLTYIRRDFAPFKKA